MAACLGHSAHPFKFLAVQVVGAGYLCSGVVDALLPLLEVVRVVSPVGVNGLIVEFKNQVAHFIKKIPVVCHHK